MVAAIIFIGVVLLICAIIYGYALVNIRGQELEFKKEELKWQKEKEELLYKRQLEAMKINLTKSADAVSVFKTLTNIDKLWEDVENGTTRNNKEV